MTLLELPCPAVGSQPLQGPSSQFRRTLYSLLFLGRQVPCRRDGEMVPTPGDRGSEEERHSSRPVCPQRLATATLGPLPRGAEAQCCGEQCASGLLFLFSASPEGYWLTPDSWWCSELRNVGCSYTFDA